jgi:ATP-dependent RNA helicase DHX33
MIEVPQFLLESDSFGGGIIAITQPRKVAATSLADRVAKEQNVELGTRVGYSVRFDDNTSPETRIKYLTDGMLVRELLTDELLTKYSVVIIDEAHERTLRTDLLLSSLKTIQKRRNTKSETTGSKFQPLKVVVMSATLDAKRFSKFFNKCVHI